MWARLFITVHILRSQIQFQRMESTSKVSDRLTAEPNPAQKAIMEQLVMTRLQAMTSLTVLVSFGLIAQVVAEKAALFDVSKCSCIGDLCTCPDVQGVFFTKAQIDALKAVPKPSKPLEIPDTLKQ